VTGDQVLGTELELEIGEKRMAMVRCGAAPQSSVVHQTAEPVARISVLQKGVLPIAPTAIEVGRTFSDKLQDGSKGPEMVTIPAGEFQMGSPASEAGRVDDETQHPVKVVSFAMGVYEVTFAEYDRFAQATKRELPGDDGWGRENRPVINVSWHDAVAYTSWLSEQTGKRYRLPTEAEWEYAARAGSTTAYWWGDGVGRNHANCYGCGSQWDNKKQTVPVGSFERNEFGLYDVLGNVWEWTCSPYAEKWDGNKSACNNADTQTWRVIRGGSWNNIPRYLRSSIRNDSSPDFRNYFQGFRVIRDL